MIVTVFSWGYWGWGSATEQLVKAADAGEAAHGFQPPIFVDARLRRQGRAKGFVGNAFRDLVGESRYHWLDDLGNLAIATGRDEVEIKNPAAVSELLDLALLAADERRRVMFYCACEFPRLDGKLACHRLTITDLLLAHAKKIGQAISVVEWPGGEPVEAQLEVDRKLFAALMRNQKSIPFSTNRLNDFAGLPWGSVVALKCEGGTTTGNVLVGPARFAASRNGVGFWYLPVLRPPESGASTESLRAYAAQWRTAHGLDERKSG
ncbi:MAG: hypothetical protein IVW54_02490 [Candidatus Binataceae bacterium]|nr:hypothetical protein [Candidatus Binataceae bacterium]